MKITVKTALEMLNAIGQLDSYQNGADKPTLYRYGGDTRLQIAITRRKLRQISEDFTDARNALLLEVSDGVGELPALPLEQGEERRKALRQHVSFNERERELLLAEVELDVKALSIEALKLEDNPIPATVLDLLGDLIHAP